MEWIKDVKEILKAIVSICIIVMLGYIYSTVEDIKANMVNKEYVEANHWIRTDTVYQYKINIRKAPLK